MTFLAVLTLGKHLHDRPDLFSKRRGHKTSSIPPLCYWSVCTKQTGVWAKLNMRLRALSLTRRFSNLILQLFWRWGYWGNFCILVYLLIPIPFTSSWNSKIMVMVFNTTFNNISNHIVAVSFIGGGNRNTRKKTHIHVACHWQTLSNNIA